MSKHNVHEELRDGYFPSTLTIIPYSSTKGAIKYGSGVPTGTPDAQFYINTAPTSSANALYIDVSGTWTSMSEAGVGDGFTLTGSIAVTDAGDITFGTDSDFTVAFDGTQLEILPGTDDTGAVNFGDGTTDADVKIFLGASTDFVRFDVGNGNVEFDNAELVMGDSDEIVFGDGSDMKLEWNGSRMTSGPATGLWAGAPSPLDPSPYAAHVFFDDFFIAPVDANLIWTEVDDGTTGTNAVADAPGGVGNIVTVAEDNDYHAISSVAETFDLADTKELWFEARFKLTEAATNESAWWFGLTDTLTTGGFQLNSGGPLPTYDGVIVSKYESSLDINVETSNSSTQDTELAIATFASGTWTRVGFHVSAAATTAIVTAYFDIDDSGVMTAHSNTMELTRSGLQDMHVVAGVKAGPSGNAETLQVDYIKCVQIR